MSNSQLPFVSIGMPIFNGAETLRKAIDSVLNQTYKNFELIISDNCSTDSTHLICQEYAEIDSRILYFSQQENIGAPENFKFVFEKASGKYFMWAASDDFRTPDFINENIQFLEKNPTCVASTSPNFIEGQGVYPMNVVSFDIQGNISDRFKQFFQHCWRSHGIFYSLIRTSVLRECEVLGQSFIAFDWAIDLYLVSRGNINRVKRGLIIFGGKGISSRRNSYRIFRNQPIEIFFPFYRLTFFALKISRDLTFFERLYLLWILLKLNIKVIYDQLSSVLYQFYCAHLRSLRKSN
jgi:glycosyltransferase involved in cell wall biosynthesis